MLKKYESVKKSGKLVIVSILSFAILFSACIQETDVPLATANNVGVPTDEVQEATDPPTSLDLREANVLAVEFERLTDDDFLFKVTLVHDDDGESPNFADSWQVEDSSGNVLGVRILTHSHDNQPFTRSETIDIPSGVTTVVVRGHDMLHGHGGQSMSVNLSTGAVEAFIEEGG